jgi:hypothetical protein
MSIAETSAPPPTLPEPAGRRPIPISCLVGLVASTLAFALWFVDQSAGDDAVSFWIMFIAPIAPKVAVVITPFFFFLSLQRLLYKRPRLAVAFCFSACAVTICAMAIYLPWREGFTRTHGNDAVKWYNAAAEAKKISYPYFDEWKWRWDHYIQQTIEMGLVIGYFALIGIGCVWLRPSKRAAILIGALAYLWLLVMPVATGLSVWDYDFFLGGIALDSISLDLFPIAAWLSYGFSIFLYVFSFILFAVGAVFFWREHLRLQRLKADTLN